MLTTRATQTASSRSSTEMLPATSAIHPRKHDQVNHTKEEYACYERGVCISTNTIKGVTTPKSSNDLRFPLIAATSGKAAPLGATVSREGVNVSIYARDASSVELLLFSRDDEQPTNVLSLEPYAIFSEGRRSR